MTYKVSFASQWDIAASGDEDLIKRCGVSPYVSILAQCDTGAIYMTVFTDDDTLSFVKTGELSDDLRHASIRIMRKSLRLIGGKLTGYAKTCDLRANRLLKVLGFSRVDENPAYNKYVGTW